MCPTCVLASSNMRACYAGRPQYRRRSRAAAEAVSRPHSAAGLWSSPRGRGRRSSAARRAMRRARAAGRRSAMRSRRAPAPAALTRPPSLPLRCTPSPIQLISPAVVESVGRGAPLAGGFAKHGKVGMAREATVLDTGGPMAGASSGRVYRQRATTNLSSRRHGSAGRGTSRWSVSPVADERCLWKIAGAQQTTPASTPWRVATYCTTRPTPGRAARAVPQDPAAGHRRPDAGLHRQGP